MKIDKEIELLSQATALIKDFLQDVNTCFEREMLDCAIQSIEKAQAMLAQLQEDK